MSIGDKTATIVRPPEYRKPEGQTIFLAGPIWGGPDWQSGAIEFLKHDSRLTIASPRTLVNQKADNRDWEHHYLGKAVENGVIMFWLAKEETHVGERAYAQTTRFELGWHFGLALCIEKVQMVVGIEPGFSNGHYLRYTISKHAPSIPICSAFDETCCKVLELIHT